MRSHRYRLCADLLPIMRRVATEHALVAPSPLPIMRKAATDHALKRRKVALALWFSYRRCYRSCVRQNRWNGLTLLPIIR